jgi:capsular polysaccharide biosynthesis protein
MLSYKLGGKPMNQSSNKWKSPEEREISISAMFWKILYSWRLLVVAAIIFAVLLTTFRYVKDKNAIQADDKTTATYSVKHLSTQERATLASAESLQKQLEDKEDYIKSSILMKLNPYQKDVVTLQYYVDNGYAFKLNSDITKDSTASLINSYLAYINDSGLLQKVCKSLNWDTKDTYVAELIETSNKMTATNDNANQNSVFSVYLSAEDSKKANQLADAVVAAIDDYQTAIAGKIGTHQLKLVDRYVGKETDNGLADKQNSIETSIMSIRSQLNTLTAGFSVEQKQLLAKDSGTVEKISTTDLGQPSISKKYMVLGVIVGLFLACVWIVLSFVLDNHLKTVQELENFYNVRVVGRFAKDNNNKRLFASVDKWIDTLQHKDKVTVEQQKDMTLMNLKMTCKQQNIQHLFMNNTVELSEKERQNVNTLVEGIRSLGITVDVGDDILHNANSFEKMVEIGNVIFIEKIEETYHNVFEQELRLCEEQRTQVLGVITFV